MATYYATIVAKLSVEAKDQKEADSKMYLLVKDIVGVNDTVFCFKAKTDKCSLHERVNIKEKVKEVYAKLKNLSNEKNVNTYYDLLEVILKL
jgi:hypothetical protein